MMTAKQIKENEAELAILRERLEGVGDEAKRAERWTANWLARQIKGE